jgi:triosephosphate isomerase
MPKKKPLIVANWKMYKTGEEAKTFVEALQVPANGDVWIAPPFTAIEAASRLKKVMIGAQNMNAADEGAFTGEISARMLLDVGAKFVILGHSERRRLFHETSDVIMKKVEKALSAGLKAILCIGETGEERSSGQMESVLRSQLKNCPSGSDVILAYEPVWAIGTGKTATPGEANEAHKLCRIILGRDVPILYGGSVTPDNIKTLLEQPEINGALVGGASLKIETFQQLLGSL